MVAMKAIDASAGDVVVLVGTTKGLFALAAGPDRESWDRAGPWFRGEEICAAALDCRDGRTRLLVGATSSHWGPSVYRSDDLGASWVEPEPDTLRFPDATGAAVARVWQLRPAGSAQPDVVYAGVEPAALFRSDDRGESFRLDEGLWAHEHRPQGQPAGGGRRSAATACRRRSGSRSWPTRTTWARRSWCRWRPTSFAARPTGGSACTAPPTRARRGRRSRRASRRTTRGSPCCATASR